MIRKIVVIVFLLKLHFCFAQSVFNRAYDYDSTFDGGRTIIQTLDGGFLLGGSGDGDIFTVKTNYQGDTEWVKYIDPNPGPYGSGISAAIQLQDSNYVLCGFTKDTFPTARPDILLLKLDKNGDSIIWLKRYGGAYNDYGDDVKQTEDGGFIMVASTYSFGADSNDMNTYLIKTDNNGFIEWDTVFGNTLYNSVEAVAIARDGGYVFAIGDSGRIWLMKVNKAGNMVWEKKHKYNNNYLLSDEVMDIRLTSDGGFILAGYLSDGLNNDAYMIKVDSIGNKEWEKVYLNSVSESSLLYGVVQLSDSSYVAAGSAYDSLTGGRHDGLLMKTDKNGNLLWYKFYTHYGATAQDYFYDIDATTDGGFIMCGDAFGAGVFKQDMLLVKTDCEGNEIKWDSVNCLGWNGISEPRINNEQPVTILIYPNPFSTNAVVRITNNSEFANEKLQFTLYDVLGREVHHQTLNSEHETLNLNLPNGVYFYQVRNKKEILGNGKIIIE